MRLLGMGFAVPSKRFQSEELVERLKVRFDVDVRRAARALTKRLGVESRCISRDLSARVEAPRSGEGNADLAANALRNALRDAGIGVDDLHYLIAHTATPGQLIPPNVARIAELIGYDGPFVELRQACTGFANATIMARGLLDAPGAGPIAIVGSETGSVYFDPLRVRDDQGQLVNMMQMGDAAAACIVAPFNSREDAATLSHLYFGQVGRQRAPGFKLASGGSDAPSIEHAVLEFQHDYVAVRESGPILFREGIAAARALDLDIHAVDYLLPHQANGKMAELLSDAVGVPASRIFVNADRYGNTGSAAIWLALTELRQRLRAGERALVLGAEATKHMFGGFLYTHA